MENFNQLSYALMIGSANGAKLSEAMLSELNKLGIQFSADFAQQEPAAQLLTAAAAYAPLLQAATQPLAWEGDEEATGLEQEDDNLAYCSEELSNALIFILKDHHEEIFSEFIHNFDTKKYRLPDWLLPDLLNFGVQHQSLQAAIADLLGKRGQWLAQFRTEWAYINDYFIDTQNSDIFEYGSEKQRLRWFAQLRKESPSTAYELLAQVWKSEKTEMRAKLLECLRVNFSPTEEEFVLQQLQDRRKEVRDAALLVLEQNPTGQWQKMLFDIAKDWLKIEQSEKQTLLKVELPDKHSAELAALGIKANLHQIEGGEKASWLLQLCSKLHPDNLLSLQPDLSKRDWLQLLLLSDWRRSLLCGLWAAAQRFGAQDWLYELHKLYLQNHSQNYWRSYPAEQLPLGLDSSHFEQVANLYLEDAQKSFSDTHPLINLLNNAPHWNLPISRQVLVLIDKHSSKENFSLYYGLKALLQRAAYAVDAAVYPFARELWEQPSEHKAYNWIKDFRQFLTILQIRHFLVVSD